MVYMGRTDSGRFIPELLNETSNERPCTIFTINFFYDQNYLDYLGFVYGSRLAPLTSDDYNQGVEGYINDFLKRQQHDHDFPSSDIRRKQIFPGETVTNINGTLRPDSLIALWKVNEMLLQILLRKNPNVPFAIEESFPLKSTYTNSTTLGPIIELGVSQAPNTLNAERVTKSIDYWRGAAQQLLSQPEISKWPAVRLAYAKMALGQARLFDECGYKTGAEDVSRLAYKICPDNEEIVFGLAGILFHAGHADEAMRLEQGFTENGKASRTRAVVVAALVLSSFVCLIVFIMRAWKRTNRGVAIED